MGSAGLLTLSALGAQNFGVKGTAAQNHTADECGRNTAKKNDRQAAIRSGGTEAAALAEGEVRDGEARVSSTEEGE